MTNKISIRFYNDHEVRAVWSDERGGNELATNCSQLKLMAADGKRYLTDDITSREMFMKGIDYSYYYEQL